MKYLSLWAGAIVIFLSYHSSAAHAYEYPYDNSVAPKFTLFFPNSDEMGLKGFGTGIGTGADVRFVIVRTPAFNLQAGPEMGFEGFSLRKDKVTDAYGGTMTATYVFNAFKSKGNLLFVFPVGRVSLWVGGGIVLTSVFVFGTISDNSGNEIDYSATGSGVGAQGMGGINIQAGRRGSVTIELTVPISQKHTLRQVLRSRQTSYETTQETDVNVGGVELMAGYRFGFALPYPEPEEKPQAAPEGKAEEEKQEESK